MKLFAEPGHDTWNGYCLQDALEWIFIARWLAYTDTSHEKGMEDQKLASSVAKPSSLKGPYLLGMPHHTPPR